MGVSCGKQSEGKYSIRDRLFGGQETSVCGESGRYTFAMIGRNVSWACHLVLVGLFTWGWGRVQDRFEFSLEQMRELVANAVEASFLRPERKLELLRRVEQYGVVIS
jgi:hypothetical protein